MATVVDPLLGSGSLSGMQRGVVTEVVDNALTADGKGSWVNCLGINGYILVEVVKTGAGTVSAAFNGTLDTGSAIDNSSSPISVVRYAKLGSAGALTTVVTATALGAGSTQSWFVLQDRFPSMGMELSATAGAVSVTTRYYFIPV